MRLKTSRTKTDQGSNDKNPSFFFRTKPTHFYGRRSHYTVGIIFIFCLLQKKGKACSEANKSNKNQICFKLAFIFSSNYIYDQGFLHFRMLWKGSMGLSQSPFFFFKEAELNFECSFFITLFIIKVSDMFCYCCLILSSALNHNIGVYICCLLWDD